MLVKVLSFAIGAQCLKVQVDVHCSSFAETQGCSAEMREYVTQCRTQKGVIIACDGHSEGLTLFSLSLGKILWCPLHQLICNFLMNLKGMLTVAQCLLVT